MGGEGEKVKDGERSEGRVFLAAEASRAVPLVDEGRQSIAQRRKGRRKEGRKEWRGFCRGIETAFGGNSAACPQ